MVSDARLSIITRWRKWIKPFIMGGAVILVAVMVTANIYRINHKDVVAVTVVKVAEKHMVETVPASGTVVANDKKVLFTKNAGCVTKVNTSLGAQVKTGQVLLEMDIPGVEQKLVQAQSDLANSESALYHARVGGQSKEYVEAQATLEQARTHYENDQKSVQRDQVLFQQGAISQASLDADQVTLATSQAAYKKAQANLQSVKDAQLVYLQSLEAAVAAAQAKLQEMQRQADQQQMVAPQDGMVLSIAVKPGDVVATNTALLSIAGMNDLSIQANVPEAEAGKIRIGQEATICGNAFSQDTYHGKVTQVGLETVNKVIQQQAENSYLPIVVQPGEPAPLLPGYRIDLEITTEEADVLVVPAEALVQQGKSSSIYVIKEGNAYLIPVKTGANDGISVEIKNGVSENDQVVITPPAILADGTRVHIL